MRQRLLLWPVFLLVFCAAFWLRFYKLPPHLMSGDDALTPSWVVDAYPDSWSLSSFTATDHRAAGNPLRLAAYYYGMLYPGLMWLSGLLFSLCGFPVREIVFTLPALVLGAATPLLAFKFFDRFFSRNAAWLALLLLTVLPSHMIPSRCHIPSVAQGLFMQLAVLYAFFNYLEKRSAVSALGAGVMFALYIHTHLEWMAMAPLLVAAAFLWESPASFAARLSSTARALLRWQFWLPPVLSVAALIGIYFAFGGPVKHLLHKSGKGAPGFYFLDWCVMNIDNNGYGIVPVLLVGVPGLLYGLFRFDRRTILCVWALVYSAPYWFWIHSEATMTTGYITHGTCAFLMVFCVTMAAMAQQRPAFPAKTVIALTAGALLYSGAAKCYTLPLPFSLHDQGYVHRQYEPDKGYKAAGYWVRKNVKSDQMLYSFTVGGGGMEYDVCAYYLDRLTYVIDDAEAPRQREFFATVEPEIDYVLLEELDRDEWTKSPHAANFIPAVEITRDNKLVMVILARRDTHPAVVTLDAAEINRQFDEEYGTLRSLRGSQKIARRDGELPHLDFSQK